MATTDVNDIHNGICDALVGDGVFDFALIGNGVCEARDNDCGAEGVRDEL